MEAALLIFNSLRTESTSLKKDEVILPRPGDGSAAENHHSTEQYQKAKFSLSLKLFLI